jgi:hypothetical protein
MESVSVNQHMKNTGFNVGVVVPPDKFYKPVLYSDAKASRDFQQMNKDIYEGRKKAKKLNEKKTPTSVFVFLGIASLALAFPYVKNLIKR